MGAPASSTGKRCSWCATLNAASDNACSKCGAVFSSIRQPDAVTPANNEAVATSQREGYPTPDDIVVRALEESPLPHIVSSDSMRALGLAPTFVSGQTLAYSVSGCLSVYLLVSLGGALIEISKIALSPRTTPGVSTAVPGVSAGDVLAFLISLFLSGVALLTAVFFLFWIYRAHKNLKALGAIDLKYSPGWAVGGFFIPVLNLIRPYQVVTEIWKASANHARRSVGANWSYEPAPVFILAWWGAWLFSGFLGFMSFVVLVGSGGTDPAMVATRYRLLSYISGIACAALAIAVVMKINARQESANRAGSEARDRSFVGAELVSDQL